MQQEELARVIGAAVTGGVLLSTALILDVWATLDAWWPARVLGVWDAAFALGLAVAPLVTGLVFSLGRVSATGYSRNAIAGGAGIWVTGCLWTAFTRWHSFEFLGGMVVGTFFFGIPAMAGALTGVGAVRGISSMSRRVGSPR
jgi:hypothetical protein